MRSWRYWLLIGPMGFVLGVAAPISAQITDGSVTVLDGSQSATPATRRFPDNPEPTDSRELGLNEQVLTTTSIGDASSKPVNPPSPTLSSPSTGAVRSVYEGPVGNSTAAVTASESANQATAQPADDARNVDTVSPRQSSLQPQMESSWQQTVTVIGETKPTPTPTPTPTPAPAPAPTPAPTPAMAPEPMPAAEPRPEPSPALLAEPSPPVPVTQPAPQPQPALVTRRFDNLPSEGAQISAYDELLSSGVEAAQAGDNLNALSALQLNEWIAQMRSAVNGHPSVRVAQLQAQASEAGVDQARAARMPQITLSSEVGNERSVRDGGEPTSAGGIGEERDLQITPTLDASWLLFDAGSTRAGIDAAQQRVEAGDIAAVAAADQIGFQAAQTLINLATLRAQIDLAEKNLDEVRRLRAMIQERADAGRDSPSDLFRMRARVQEARNTLEQRIAAFNAARANYAEVFRADPIILGLPPAYIPVPETARSAIERAVSRNPDLRQANALAAAAKREVDARQAALWPQISLGASVTGYDVTREDDNFYDSFIGLRVNAPLFDGGSRRAQLEQQQRQASLEQARVDELRANVVQALSEAYSSRASLRPQLLSLEDQVDANQSTLDAYEEQFLAGRRPLNDLVTAQRELYGARAQLLDTQGELHLQHFSIRRLTGDLLTDYGLPRSG